MSDLTGRVALVTGGSRGIGAAIALRLAADGADVAITYLTADDRAAAVVAAIERTGRRGLALRADSADTAAVARAVDDTAARLGRLDVLVNNAGVFPYGPFEEVGRDELDRVLAIHVGAAFTAAQAASRHMGPGGRIISIGSNLAERAGQPGIALYSMSKAALTGLSRGLAHDLGPRGITVNVVHPGSTDTDMNPADGPDADAQRARTALGAFQTADDVAATVAHLAGEGGRTITGAALLVDSGANA
ncbi:SDR family NAD(P)-dependent oxidoreductase [Pseudonocardia humida]|uniref:SDR family oxidoreductase n=1 Tax=Pseudonocardia humida TaxID=2800819 RepID=A0ABT1A5A8_9PSEU|nr:SDR family oxidoreductase [Pseudonocardia humida]MCO1658160.1 SDR family oxidoreductase [Pseudonocardia humida]